MTAKEVIDELQNYPPDTIVFMSEHGGKAEVTDIHYETSQGQTYLIFDSWGSKIV